MIIGDPVLARRRHRGSLRRVLIVLTLDLLIVLALQAFVFHASMIVWGAMKPVYDIGETVIALRRFRSDRTLGWDLNAVAAPGAGCKSHRTKQT